MFILSLSGKKTIKILLTVTTVFVILGILLCIFMSKPENSPANKYIDSLKSADAREDKVEVFDISQGKVIRELDVTPELRAEALSYIKKISSAYVKVMALPSMGKIVKIPLNPNVRVSSRLLNGVVKNVFILFPEGGQPYLMVLDEKNRPLFYNFEADTKKLTELVGFERMDDLPAPVFYIPESRL